jgi:hypothetical protein
MQWRATLKDKWKDSEGISGCCLVSWNIMAFLLSIKDISFAEVAMAVASRF